MMSKISYSAWGKYLTCPKMYDLHYNEKLRPTGKSSALAFGVAIDAGLNTLLLTGSFDNSVKAFREAFEYKDMTNVEFDPRDYDPYLVPADTKGDGNYLAWASLRIKGRMLLEVYYNEIYPLIEEVENVQRELSDRPGVTDAILRLRGHGRVLIDHKSSARPYAPDAVINDTQLALYAKNQGCDKAGFIVLIKEIDKQIKRTCVKCKFDGSYIRHKSCPNEINSIRCHGDWRESTSPKAKIQLLIDTVPEINKEIVEASLSQVETAIQQNHFYRNLKACGKQYGKPCPYINFCWHNSKDGLECKKEDK
jgi:hypothetical protein